VRKYIDTINSVKLGTLPGLVTIVNGTAFGVYGTWDKYTLKVHNIQESPKRDSFEVAGTRYTVDYFEVEVELHWRRDGWREAVSDRGISRHVFPGGPDGRGGTFSQTDFPAGVPGVAAILDANLQPIAHPVPLDGAGQPLAAGQPHKFITYGLYPEIDPTYSPHISCALEKR
jgi:hypothetical protein